MTSTAVQLSERTNWTAPQWHRILSVYVEENSSSRDVERVPMAGTYQVDPNRLQFIPAFPLSPGVSYRAVFNAGALPGVITTAKELTAVYSFAEPKRNVTTVVTQVYPTAAALPENLLKFYIHFSAPMSRGHVYDYIHLRAETGSNVELPFLELPEELWDPTMTRLTLLLDPGRITRGVRPLEEIGPSLQNGHRYTLVINHAWPDASGYPLAKDFEKSFLVTPPDREPLEPEQWRIEVPPAGTRKALAVQLPNPEISHRD
jgi:hypothetical protein